MTSRRAMPVSTEVPVSLRCASPEIDAGQLDEIDELPLVEVLDTHCVVTFLRHAPAAEQVYVQVNRVTHTLEQARMERGEGGWWRASFRLPREWRGSYSFFAPRPGEGGVERLAPREAMRMLRTQGEVDPRNTRVETTHTSMTMSWAEGDRAPVPDWWEPRRPLSHPASIPRPRELHTPGGRRVWVHVPGATTSVPRPLVVVLDGTVWVASGAALPQAQALADAGRICEPVVVFVDPVDADQRWDEMSADGSACSLVADDVVPWARARFGAGMRPEHVVVTGESLGGLTAIRTVLERPDRVQRALSQSASTWQDPLLDRGDSSGQGRFFLTAGQFESSLLGGHLALVERFSADGRLVGHREFCGGHDMVWWRGYWGEGLAALLDPPV